MADNTMKFLDLAGLQKLWARIGEVFVRKADITDDLAKLKGIQAGAQVNKVETLQVTNGTDKLTFANDPENNTTWVIKNVTNLEDEQANILAPTAKAVKDAIDVVAKSVTDKNVSAEGDDYIAASADSNKVTVSATEKTKAAIALAETALQKADITTGGANGTIAVEGTDVAVQGLGSAAFTESTAYDAAGAATTAAAGALTSAQSYTDNKLSDLGLTKALGSAAFTETTAYATAAQGTLADSALQEVIGSDYITVTDKKTISAKTGKVEDGADVLAVASDVKTYVTNQIDEVKELVTASTEFLGVFTSVADANAKSPAKGDIMAIAGAAEGTTDYDKNGKEFIYDGNNWIELGDTTAEQKRLTALESRAGALETAVTETLPGNIATAKNEAITAAKDYTDGIVGTLPTTGEGDEAKTMTVAEAIAAAEKSAKDHTNGLVGTLPKGSDTVVAAINAAKDAANDYTDGLIGTLPKGSDTVVAAINAAKDAAINAAAGNITQDAANAALPTGAFNLVSEVSKDGKTVAAKYYTFEKISDAEIAALK